ncbi:asparagine synthase-domain-containing protein [Lyophyllum atratum]|nr:asparagine synthase-domain-containing protein [Lyophyllum atratum]
MCGIFFSVRSNDADCGESGKFQDLNQKLQAANAARGPDAQGFYKVSIPPSAECGSGNLSLEFYASELRLRGEGHVVQPHRSGGDVLCWNGEIFDGMDISPQENDGVKLFEKLRRLDTMEQIRDLFASIEGPYAFVYYQSSLRRLFFARDPLGRRSLLIHKPTPVSPYLLLASVSAGIDPRYDFEELCTDHIYCLDLSQVQYNLQDSEFSSAILPIPRRSSSPQDPSFSSPFAEPSKVNTLLPPPEDITPVENLSQVPEHLTKVVEDFIYHLDRSVMLRVRNIPYHSTVEGQARVAVLFSGGIDSTVITFLAHKHIPLDEPIDLLNVAFENPRKIKAHTEGNPGGISKRQRKSRARTTEPAQGSTHTSYAVPDRVTGLQEVEELRRLCPGRVWNFVEVNVPYEESRGARQTIESLMLPGRTVMDMSLALALYFASRGVGQVRSFPGTESKPYTSTARVLLNGLGSDELLGGYGRHRSAYIAGGWQSVIEELQLEIDRIPIRNLGRDDRVIASHGKETRHPFLSLTVVDFLARLPVHHKMDPRLEIGLGDKMLLRLATCKLGLIEASQRKKRAMQFGSHSARMDGERRGDTTIE